MNTMKFHLLSSLILLFTFWISFNYIFFTFHRIWPRTTEEMWSGTFISVFGVTTWLLPYENYNPNVPAWTISTLSFWYWCYPFIFPRLQRLTNNELAQGMVKYFWLGVGINILLFFGLGFFIPGGNKVKSIW